VPGDLVRGKGHSSGDSFVVSGINGVALEPKGGIGDAKGSLFGVCVLVGIMAFFLSGRIHAETIKIA